MDAFAIQDAYAYADTEPTLVNSEDEDLDFDIDSNASDADLLDLKRE